MGFEEFQRQQTALKEKDRENKNAATTGLHSYKGGEYDIKHEKALTDIRASTRLRKISAVRNQHGYNEYHPPPLSIGLTSPNKDAQGSSVLHDKEKEDHTNSCLSRYGGTEADKRAALADEATEAQKVAKEEAENEEPAERAATEEAARREAEIKQAKKEEAAKKSADTEATKDADMHALKDDVKAAVAEEEDANRAAIEALAGQWSRVAFEDGSPTIPDQGMSMHHGCRIELDFQFGLFYPSTQPPPEWGICTQAAASIVSNKIRMGKSPVSYHSEFPPVVKTIAKDDAFMPGKSEKGLFRYIVRGIVPVFQKEDKAETAPIRRSLKKHASFVPVQQPVEKETIVEDEQGDQWKRVREGKPVAWEEIVEKSPCPSTLH